MAPVLEWSSGPALPQERRTESASMARAGIASLTTGQGVLWRRKVKLVNTKLCCSSDLTQLHSKLAGMTLVGGLFLE